MSVETYGIGVRKKNQMYQIHIDNFVPFLTIAFK